MRVTKARLRQIIKEEISSDSALLSAIEKLVTKIDGLDVSIDYLAAAVTGEDVVSIGYAQDYLGRYARPPPKKASPSPLEEIVQEEVERLIAEADLDWEAEKRKAKWATLRKAAIAAGLVGVVGGTLQSQISDFEALRAQASAERTAQNVAAANTDEAQLEEFADQLNNTYRFLWGKGNQIAVPYPGFGGDVTVLPASYSLAVQAFLDKKANLARIERGEDPIMRYGDVEFENLPSISDVKYQGTVDDNIDKFFDVYSGSDMIDAMALLRAVPELQVVPGTAMEKAIVMVKPGNIDPSYVLPEIGMTAEDYYNSQYGDFMGSGEKAALDLPDEEMTVTPDDDDKEMLDQGIIDATNRRALKHQQRSMKENRVTWKNYKNRKKKLAQSMVV